MMTTDLSRQSSGALAGSQLVGVGELYVHWRTPSPSWLPQGHVWLRKPLSSSVHPDDNP